MRTPVRAWMAATTWLPFEAMRRPLGKPGRGLSRDVGGMIVEDQFDRGRGWVGRIDKLEKLNELAAAMAITHQGMHLTTDKIDPGKFRINSQLVKDKKGNYVGLFESEYALRSAIEKNQTAQFLTSAP